MNACAGPDRRILARPRALRRLESHPGASPPGNGSMPESSGSSGVFELGRTLAWKGLEEACVPAWTDAPGSICGVGPGSTGPPQRHGLSASGCQKRGGRDNFGRQLGQWERSPTGTEYAMGTYWCRARPASSRERIQGASHAARPSLEDVGVDHGR